MARSVVTTFTANVSGYMAGIGKMQAATVGLAKSATESATKHKADWDKIGNATAVASVAIAAGVGLAVKKFADFDAAMSAVGANSGAVGAELAALRSTAMEFGAATQFSATEAAQGINELAKAGVSTADIMGGALKGSLDLAAAGQIGVAEAAESTASALNQFGLEGGKAGHVADLLSNAANAAQGTVGDMSAALGQAGVAANAAGLNIDETTTLLALFAKAGMTGSDAGTSLKTMMQRLAAPTAEAATELDRLGISAYDSQGNFRGAEVVLGELSTQTANMSTQARAAAFSTIFGSDAIRAASIAAEAGAEGYRAMNAEVTRFGGASEQAAALTDNLKGDLERLGGAFDTLLISTGEASNSGLRSFVQGLQGVVEAVGRIPGPALLAGAGLASLVLALPKGVSIYQEFKGSLSAIGLSMDNIATKSPRAGKALEATGRAAGVAGKAFAALAVASAAANILTDDSTSVGVQGLTADLVNAADAVKEFSGVIKANAADMGFIQDDVTSFGDVLRTTFDPGFLDSFTSKGDSALRTITLGMLDMTTSTDDAAARLGDLDAVLSGLVSGGNAAEADKLFAQFAAAAKESGVSVEDLKSKLPGYTESLAAAGNAARGTASAADDLAESTYTSAKAARDAADGTATWAEELDQINSPILDARDAARQFEQAVDDASGALKDNGKTLDIGTEKGRKNQAALDGVARAALDQIGAMQANGASQKQLQGTLDTSRDRLYAVGRSFGMSKTEARQYADQVLKTPKSVSTTVTARTEAAKAQVAAFQSQINRLRGNSVTITTRYVTVGKPGGGRRTAGGLVADADGGLHVKAGVAGAPLVKAYADGGLAFDGSFASAQPQVRSAGGRGILWAEEGAGPWEGFVSGHPSKRGRSRGITEDIAGRLGGEVNWLTPMADGGIAQQISTLGPRAIAARGGGPMSVTNVTVEINGPVDQVAAGAQFERILQQYTSVTGRPLQVVTR